jgi:GNAT superfamily N-acetyltransferase
VAAEENGEIKWMFVDTSVRGQGVGEHSFTSSKRVCEPRGCVCFGAKPASSTMRLSRCIRAMTISAVAHSDRISLPHSASLWKRARGAKIVIYMPLLANFRLSFAISKLLNRKSELLISQTVGAVKP